MSFKYSIFRRVDWRATAVGVTPSFTCPVLETAPQAFEDMLGCLPNPPSLALLNVWDLDTELRNALAETKASFATNAAAKITGAVPVKRRQGVFLLCATSGAKPEDSKHMSGSVRCLLYNLVIEKTPPDHPLQGQLL